MWREDHFMRWEQLGERLFVVREQFAPGCQNFNMYVVAGQTRAAVIDAGLGATRALRPFIEAHLGTALPLDCYMTHGDIDHIGSAVQFDSAWLNRRDWPKLPWNQNLERRFSDMEVFTGNNAEIIAYARAHYQPDDGLRLQDIEDGAVLDLGGVCLEAIRLPGHTPGSMAYYNAAEHYAFVGDATSPMGSWQRCGDYRACLQDLRRFADRMPEDVTLYHGHRVEPQGKAILRQMCTALEEVLAGKNTADVPVTGQLFPMVDEEERGYDLWRHPCGEIAVLYNRNVL